MELPNVRGCEARARRRGRAARSRATPMSMKTSGVAHQFHLSRLTELAIYRRGGGGGAVWSQRARTQCCAHTKPAVADVAGLSLGVRGEARVRGSALILRCLSTSRPNLHWCSSSSLSAEREADSGYPPAISHIFEATTFRLAQGKPADTMATTTPIPSPTIPLPTTKTPMATNYGCSTNLPPHSTSWPTMKSHIFSLVIPNESTTVRVRHRSPAHVR